MVITPRRVRLRRPFKGWFMPHRCSLLTLLMLLPLWSGGGGCDRRDPAESRLALKLAHVYEVRSPTHHYGAALLGERLAALDANLSITVFPAAGLGNEEELLEQLVAGELELAISGPSFLAMWHPPLGIFDAAYAFRDLDHMRQFAASPRWRA